MKATEILKGEHKHIKSMLSVLGKVARKLESGENVEADHLEKLVEFIRNFSDKFHHGKEEDLLFVAMEKAGVPRDGGPIGCMLEEHDTGRTYVVKMAAAAGEYKNGNGESGRIYAKNARNFVNLLSPHIDKEDTILYDIADSELSDEQQQELEEEFSKVEAVKIGEGKAQEYLDFLKSMEETYLN